MDEAQARIEENQAAASTASSPRGCAGAGEEGREFGGRLNLRNN
jgi:hypothetical protein